MRQYLDILKRTRLFFDLSDEEIFSILNCLNAKVRQFKKGATIFADGEQVTYIGVILLGEIQSQKTDFNGNENIVSKLYSSDVVAASACYSTQKFMPFDLKCVSMCQILCLDAQKLIRPCENACPHHSKLVKNMLTIIADRNVELASKIVILTKRTIREKVLAYLLAQSKKSRSKKFSIPLTRRQMAEFLSINRSALSRELCNLRDENILDFEGNKFYLKT